VIDVDAIGGALCVSSWRGTIVIGITYEGTMVSGFRYLDWCRMQTVQFRHDCFLSRASVAADIPSWHIMKEDGRRYRMVSSFSKVHPTSSVSIC
jgi:hypothetical protein